MPDTSEVGVKITELPAATSIADTDLIMLGNPTSGVLYAIPFGVLKTFFVLPTALSFVSQPANASVTTGGAASFVGVWVGGKGPFNCTWKLNGSALTGGTSTTSGNSSSYGVSNAQSANAGNYSLTVVDSLNVTIVSNAALLTVNAPVGASLSIGTLVNKTVSAGQSVTQSITASNGSTPYSYQWQKSTDGGTSWANIAGATAASYTISSAANGDAASYRVIVGDNAGSSITSNVATLTVNAVTTKTILYAWFASNPYVNNSTAIDLTGENAGSIQITPGSNISIQFPSSAQGDFLVIGVPSSEPTPVTYYHTTFINGTIGDQGFWPVFTVSGEQYICSRAEFPLDNTLPLLLNH